MIITYGASDESVAILFLGVLRVSGGQAQRLLGDQAGRGRLLAAAFILAVSGIQLPGDVLPIAEAVLLHRVQESDVLPVAHREDVKTFKRALFSPGSPI